MSRKQIQMANLLMNIIMSIILTIIGTLVINHGTGQGPIAWGTSAAWQDLCQTWLTAFFVGFTVGDLLPSIEWGTKLGAKVGAKPGTWFNYLFQVVVLTVVMVTVIVAFLILIKAGFAAWWMLSSMVFWPLMGAAFIVILLTLKPVMILVSKMSDSGPAAH